MKKLIAMLVYALMVVPLMLTGPGAGFAQNGKKVLIEGRPSDCVTLDPTNAADNASWRVARQMYECLVGFKPGSFDPAPSLATSWMTSPDGKTWTFTLRKGVKFHDGTDFNADAVVFNIERWWDSSHPYHTGKFPNVPSFFGGFKGSENSIIKDVKAIDNSHVQIELNKVFPAFLAFLGDPTTSIISPDAIKKYGDKIGQNPVGTGPFVFQEWKHNDNIALVKNPKYWQSGLPKLDKLLFKVIPDNSARLIALQSGEIDFMATLNPSDLEAVTGNSDLQLISRPPINCAFFFLNTSKPPFDNVKVRQAINMAVNRQGIIDAFYNGKGIPAKSALSPSSWAYNAEMKPYEYNLDAAKKLLAEAGYPDGLTFELSIRPEARPYLPQPTKVAESIQADLAKIGVKVKILSFEGATYAQKVYNADHQMTAWGTGGNDPDPGPLLINYFSTLYTTPPKAKNSSLYMNDKVTDLLVKGQNTVDMTERARLFQEAQQIIRDDAPIVPLIHSSSLMAAAKFVKNYIPYTDYYELYVNVDIQK